MLIMKRFGSLFLLTVFAFGLLLSACSAVTVEPTSAPTTTTPQCSVVIGSNGVFTMSEALASLGKNYYTDDPRLLINGESKNKKSEIAPGDYIVLETKPACDGEYSAAQRVDFGKVTEDPNSKTAWWREIDGFKADISHARLATAAADTCKDTRWGFQNQKLGFDGNIDGGGCNYPTFVKYSKPDGATSCVRYESMSAAYKAMKQIPDVKNVWIIVLSVGFTDKDYCTIQ